MTARLKKKSNKANITGSFKLLRLLLSEQTNADGTSRGQLFPIRNSLIMSTLLTTLSWLIYFCYFWFVVPDQWLTSIMPFWDLSLVLASSLWVILTGWLITTRPKGIEFYKKTFPELTSNLLEQNTPKDVCIKLNRIIKKTLDGKTYLYYCETQTSPVKLVDRKVWRQVSGKTPAQKKKEGIPVVAMPRMSIDEWMEINTGKVNLIAVVAIVIALILSLFFPILGVTQLVTKAVVYLLVLIGILLLIKGILNWLFKRAGSVIFRVLLSAAALGTIGALWVDFPVTAYLPFLEEFESKQTLTYAQIMESDEDADKRILQDIALRFQNAEGLAGEMVEARRVVTDTIVTLNAESPTKPGAFESIAGYYTALYNIREELEDYCYDGITFRNSEGEIVNIQPLTERASEALTAGTIESDMFKTTYDHCNTLSSITKRLLDLTNTSKKMDLIYQSVQDEQGRINLNNLGQDEEAMLQQYWQESLKIQDDVNDLSEIHNQAVYAFDSTELPKLTFVTAAHASATNVEDVTIYVNAVEDGDQPSEVTQVEPDSTEALCETAVEGYTYSDTHLWLTDVLTDNGMLVEVGDPVECGEITHEYTILKDPSKKTWYAIEETQSNELNPGMTLQFIETEKKKQVLEVQHNGTDWETIRTLIEIDKQ